MSTSVVFKKKEPQGKVEGLETCYITEGETRTFVCTFWDTITGTPTATAYRASRRTGKGTTVTSTVFPSGSVSVSGANVTLKPATGFVGPAKYVINVTATVGSDTYVRFFTIEVRRDEDMP